jgi:acyl carrier protein phosphodiesterase
MNYLAHAYLSFNKPEILAGNMISDFVKGKKQFDFAPGIQKGIQLHRAIDCFTDTHPVTQQLKTFFRPHYRLYAGVFTDVAYDYFLANDKNEFASPESLKTFSAATYVILGEYLPLLPVNFQKMFAYMKAQHWLYNYREKWLIEKSFQGLERRATYLKESGMAFTVFNDHLDEMQTCYRAFFPELKSFATYKLQGLLNG